MMDVLMDDGEMMFVWFGFPGDRAGSASSSHSVPTWYFKAVCLEVDQSEQATPWKGVVLLSVNRSFMK